MTIHFFNGETMEIIPIPFLLGLAIIILPLAVIFLIYAKVVTKKWFVCDKCGTRFKPKWYRALFKMEYNPSGVIFLKCPNCKKKNPCTESYKQH